MDDQPHLCSSQTKLPMKNSDFREMYDLYRKQMEHEDVLVNQRITFNTVVQTALVTSFIFAGNFLSSKQVSNFRIGVCGAGIFLVIYALIGVISAVYASNQLTNKCQLVINKWKICTNIPADIKELIPKRANGGGSVNCHRVGSIFGPWTFLSFGFFWFYALKSIT